jgi:hypothetical protein
VAQASPAQRSTPPVGTSRSVERSTRSRTRSAKRPKRQTSTREQGRGAVQGTSQFSGTGSRILPRVTVRRDSILRWTIQGGELRIKSKSFQMSATAHSGQTSIPRGTYRRLRVTSSTPWTLVILPP